MCASIPVGRISSPDLAGSIQSAAQTLAGQTQGVAQALGGQLQDTIQNSQSQIADAIGPASAVQQLLPVSPPSFGKPKEENRDIPMIKLPSTEPRIASGSSIEAEEGATKEVDDPHLNDKAIPVGENENVDDEEDDD